MFPAGHVWAAATVNRAAWRDDAFLPTLLGAALPDLIDKPAWALGRHGSSHRFGHTPLAAIAVWAVAAEVAGPRFARLLGTAYLSHLVADELHHGRVPWLLPLSDWKSRDKDPTARTKLAGLAIEVPALLFSAGWLARKWRDRDVTARDKSAAPVNATR